MYFCRYGDCVRSSWTNVLELVLRLDKLDLLPPAVEALLDLDVWGVPAAGSAAAEAAAPGQDGPAANGTSSVRNSDDAVTADKGSANPKAVVGRPLKSARQRRAAGASSRRNVGGGVGGGFLRSVTQLIALQEPEYEAKYATEVSTNAEFESVCSGPGAGQLLRSANYIAGLCWVLSVGVACCWQCQYCMCLHPIKHNCTCLGHRAGSILVLPYMLTRLLRGFSSRYRLHSLFKPGPLCASCVFPLLFLQVEKEYEAAAIDVLHNKCAIQDVFADSRFLKPEALQALVAAIISAPGQLPSPPPMSAGQQGPGGVSPGEAAYHRNTADKAAAGAGVDWEAAELCLDLLLVSMVAAIAVGANKLRDLTCIAGYSW